MSNKTLKADSSATTWQRVIEFKGQLTASAARSLLQFGFSEHDHALMSRLSTKARSATLTSEEQTQLDTFERLGCLLDIVHSKARQALKNGSEHSKPDQAPKKPKRRPHAHG